MSIRAFEKKDIPEVADMFSRIMLSDITSRRNLPLSELHKYFENIFFNNPWYTDEIPSLVYQGGVGEIIGFLGVVPKHMMYKGNPIRVAVSFHFMVDPKSRSSLAGIKLLKSFFAGKQDLSFTDGAGEDGKKVWCAVGGVEVPVMGLNWFKILKPARFASTYFTSRRGFARVLSSPFASLADQATRRIAPHFFPYSQSNLIVEKLDCKTMLQLLPQFSKGDAIVPYYDNQSLLWLLDEAEKMKLYGTFKKSLVRNLQGDVLGWYLYYLNSQGGGEVIQVAAKKDCMSKVLNELFHSANMEGAVNMTGQILPKHMYDLSRQRCFFTTGNITLAHSRNEELLHAIQRGDAFLSTLEGEWCLVF